MLSAYRTSSLLATTCARTTTRRVFHSTPKLCNDAASSSSPSFLSKLASFPKDNPFVFQLVIATAKTSAADIMVQVVVEKKNLSEIDWRRNGIFVVFGAVYLGGFQYWILVTKFRQWFPTMDRFAKLPLSQKIKDTAGMLDAVKMVAFDVFVHMPWMYFPAYYTCKQFVTGDSHNPIDWVGDGLTTYKNNMAEDQTAMIKLWGPSDCIQFILPVHIRMPFRHLVSFFWTGYVSFTRGGAVDEATTQEEKEAEVAKITRRVTAAGPE